VAAKVLVETLMPPVFGKESVRLRRFPLGETPIIFVREMKMPDLAERMKASLEEGTLPCAVAHSLAAEFNVPPARVGDLANELDIRIARCQLGLFGYGPKSEGKHKIVQPASDVGDELARRLREGADENRLSCATAWAIADDLKIKRLDVSCAVEALGLRMVQCQLGCF
jgi:hypothetical protein